MVDTQGVSFIPKQSTKGPRRRTVRKVYVLAYLSFVLFVGTILAAGGTFFYKVSVQSELSRQQQILVEERDRFSEADISRLQELDRRLTEASALLDNHIQVSSIFTAVESVVVDEVLFSNAEIKRDDGELITLTLNGVVSDQVAPVLFQRTLLADNTVLGNSEISEVVSQVFTESTESDAPTSEVETIVSFSLEADITPASVLYQPPVADDGEEATTDDASENSDASEGESSSETTATSSAESQI